MAVVCVFLRTARYFDIVLTLHDAGTMYSIAQAQCEHLYIGVIFFLISEVSSTSR